MVSKWLVEDDPKLVRRFGKLLEECGELTSVAARCIIQGVNDVDPSSKRFNRDRLIDEMADVLAQIQCTITLICPEVLESILIRKAQKMEQMAEWERLCNGHAEANEAAQP